MKKGKGPKTAKCSVCGEQVSKRSTLTLPDGSRACRHHEGVEEASRKKLEVEKAKRKEKIKKQQQRAETRSDNRTRSAARCMLCGIEGLHQSDYFLLMLKCIDQYRVAHGKIPNVFDAEETLDMFRPITGRVCLWVVRYTAELRSRVAKYFVDENARMAVMVMGLLMLCPECVKKHKVDISKPQFRSFGEVATIGVIFDTTLKPFIQGEIVAEFEEEKKQN